MCNYRNPNSENTYLKIKALAEDLRGLAVKYDFIVDDSISPAVLYVKKGKVYSSLVNLNDTEELSLFIDNYKLSK